MQYFSSAELLPWYTYENDTGGVFLKKEFKINWAFCDGRFWYSTLSPSIISSISLSRHPVSNSELPLLKDCPTILEMSLTFNFRSLKLLKLIRAATAINPIICFMVKMCLFCSIFAILMVIVIKTETMPNRQPQKENCLWIRDCWISTKPCKR